MNIIKELYYGNIAECQKPISKEHKLNKKLELELYDELFNKLNQNEKILFEKLIEVIFENNDNETINKYVQGFKTGLLIGIESSNIEL